MNYKSYEEMIEDYYPNYDEKRNDIDWNPEYNEEVRWKWNMNLANG